MLQRSDIFDAQTGEMEATMHRSFIRASRLKAWLSRTDCPPAIRECRILFDKLFPSGVTETADMNDNPTDDPTGTSTANIPPPAQRSSEVIPDDLAHCVGTRSVATQARFKHGGIVFARASTHLGNSLVEFYPNGDRSCSPVPGQITYIFTRCGKTQLAVQRHLPATGILDPFRHYIHLPIKLYSSRLDRLEVVEVDTVVGHVARWISSPNYAVVVSLCRVSMINCEINLLPLIPL
jgi:hypothetical protein